MKTLDQDFIVLVIAPADGRGGIASVVRLHSQTEAWRVMRARLLSTYDDRSSWRKILSAAKAYVAAPLLIARATIVHVHLAAQKSVLRKLPLILMAKSLGKPVIVHVHAFSMESLFDSTTLYAGRLTLRLADHVIALSQVWADAMTSRDASLSVSVIQNPVSTFRRNSWTPDQTPVVLYAGKLEARKGYQDLLAAAVPILKAFPSTQFWFAGHGDIEVAKAMADTYGIRESVKFMGWLSPEEMSKAYESATIFCLPSYNEGVPMVVLEAMARGIPVVCTKVGGLPNYIEHGENGLFADAGDSVSIAKTILFLLMDSSHAQTIGERGAKTIQNTCSLEAVSKQLESLYWRLLHGKPAAEVPQFIHPGHK